MGATIKTPKHIEEKIVKLYTDGYHTYDIAALLGMYQGTVHKVIKRNNITTRTMHDYYIRDDFNYKFFDEINDEASAYFLGLMFADGNNYIKSGDYQVAIKLQAEDKHILDTFRSFLAPNMELIFSPRKQKHHKDGYLFRIDSKTISNQLTALGCVPAKALVLQYPTIPYHLQNHFIRGYFDGDGSINYYNKVFKSKISRRYAVSITSSKYFCEENIKIIKQFTNLNMYSRLAHKNLGNDITTTISIGGNQQVYQLMCWLYKDAAIFFKRKHDKFLELEKEINERKLAKLK